MVNDIFRLCEAHNVQFERCRTNYLEQNPHISEDDDYNFPLTLDKFEILYNVSTKLWHGDRDWDEETDTLTHFLFFDSEDSVLEIISN